MTLKHLTNLAPSNIVIVGATEPRVLVLDIKLNKKDILTRELSLQDEV